MSTLSAGLAAASGVMAVALLASSCSSLPAPSGGDGASSSNSPAGSPAASAFTMSLAALATDSTPATAEVGPGAGGTLTTALPSGAVATLTFEAGSVDRRTTMTMVPFADGTVEGVLLGPAGTWLARPARLVFTNTERTAAIRVSLNEDGTVVFAAAPRSADGSIPVVRLRPVLLLEVAAGQLPVAGAPGSQVPGGDPVDEKAAAEEAAEADQPGGDTGQEEAAQEAAARVPDIASQCGPRNPAAAVAALEAWRTSGSPGAPPADCARLTADVLASIEWETKAFPVTFQEVVRARGSGASVDRVATIDLPAEREVSGAAALVSFVNTSVGIALAQGLLGSAQGARPSGDTCRLGDVPQGSVLLETVPLPDGKLRVTLTPKHGALTLLCDGWPPYKEKQTVWDYLRGVLGLDDGEPIVVTTSDLDLVEHVMSSVRSVEGARVRPTKNGGITVKESGLTLHALLDITLRYEPAT